MKRLIISEERNIYALFEKGFWSIKNVQANGVQKAIRVKDSQLSDSSQLLFSEVQLSYNHSDTLITVQQIITNQENKKERKFGVVKLHPNKQEISFVVSIENEFDFIDGFEHGLSRVFKIKDSSKRWGIINAEGKVVIPLIYDNIWSFYTNYSNIIRADFEGKSVELDLSPYLTNYIKKNIYDAKKTFETDRIVDNITIKNISFSNYKIFERIPPIDLSTNINFIVGKNNAGKSTFLSAIRMILGNIAHLHFSSQKQPKWNFNYSKRAMSESCCYRSALHKKGSIVEDSNMDYQIQIGDCIFRFKLIDKAYISELELIHLESNVSYNVIATKESCTYAVCFGNAQHDNCKKIIIKDVKREHNSNALEFILSIFRRLDARFEYRNINLNTDISKYELAIKESSYALTRAIAACITTEYIELFTPVFDKEFVIIPPEYTIPEKLDIISTTIIQFCEIEKSHEFIHGFVKKWINRMEIGEDFSIGKKGKKVRMSIIKKSGNVENIKDLGAGSIHFIILCLRLLSILFRTINGHKTGRYSPIIVIEEPEQNLHPMLQSHLANFFLDIVNLHKKYNVGDGVKGNGLKLMIETHSEYIIRRSQVLVKLISEVKGFEDNPFGTYYFPSDPSKPPYSLEYKEDGYFKKSFEPGFVDESSMLALKLL